MYLLSACQRKSSQDFLNNSYAYCKERFPDNAAVVIPEMRLRILVYREASLKGLSRQGYVKRFQDPHNKGGDWIFGRLFLDEYRESQSTIREKALEILRSWRKAEDQEGQKKILTSRVTLTG